MIVDMVPASIQSGERTLTTRHIRIIEEEYGIVHYQPPVPTFDRIMLKDPATGRMVERILVYGQST